jgi:parallel beta-helix repeat protein
MKTLATLLLLAITLQFTVQVSAASSAAYSNVESSIRQTYSANETWVDDDYNETTQGWRVNHFDKIQYGINAVTDGGTVHVAHGSYYESVVVNRTVILAGEDKNLTIIDGNYTRDSVLSVTVSRVSIEGFTIKNCIYLGKDQGGINIISSHNKVSNVIFKEDWIDITIYGGENRVDSCLSLNSFWNIKVWSDGNILVNNQFRRFYCAINLASSNNVVQNNSLFDGYIGVALHNSIQTSVLNNHVVNCTDSAISLEDSSLRNSVIGNVISDSGRGIVLQPESHNNTFYHNSIIKNTIQVSAAEAANKWDDGYPSGGNYWSDYNGTDENQDGIGDTAYVIDANNEDRYPLMNPFSPPKLLTDLNTDGKVNILDITLIAQAFGSSPGSPRWNPVCDLDRNGQVNIIDLTMIAKDFGKTA